MSRNLMLGMKGMLFAGVLASSLVSTAPAQSSPEKGNPATQPATASSPAPSHPHKTSPYGPVGLSPHATDHYQSQWGVDSFAVKAVESGQMIRFNYRVVNADKAKPLNDKKEAPYLIDEKAHVKLVVPTMDKVGQLRQSGTPEAGKVYWMVFSNKGNFVKPGNRVSVVIGKFRVDGLVVK